MSLDQHDTGSYMHPDDPGEPTTGKPRLSVTPQEAALLAEWVEGLSVLEIGTGLGISTKAMAATAREVHTVDVDPWVWETVWPYLPDNVITHESTASVPNVDAVFIDGDHSTAAVVSDLAAAEAVGARLVIAHDSHVLPDRDGWEVHQTAHELARKVMRRG